MSWLGLIAGALIAGVCLVVVMELFMIGARDGDKERDIEQMRLARENKREAALESVNPDKTVH